jgi:hypothetical protein
MSTQRKRASSAARRRVVDLFYAIAKLHRGDLLAVLELDRCTPLIDFGKNDIFQLDKNGKVIHTRVGPAPKSLKHRAQTGADLARIMEEQLYSMLGFGEAFLPTVGKRRMGKELGGRAFKW